MPCPPPLPTLDFAPAFRVYTEFGIDSVDADVVYTSALLADAMKPLNMLSKFENHFVIRTVSFQVQLEAGGYFSAANCNNKLSIQLVRGLLFEEDPAQSRREPQASDKTGPDRGVKQQISDPFLPRMLHPEYGTPGSFVEGRWPTAPRPVSYLHRNCRLSFPLAGIGGSGRCGSQWYLFHRKYTDA